MRELNQMLDDTGLELENIAVEFARSYEELLNDELHELNREELRKEQESVLIAMAILFTQWQRLEDRVPGSRAQSGDPQSGPASSPAPDPAPSDMPASESSSCPAS